MLDASPGHVEKKEQRLGLSGLLMSVDPAIEWAQMFNSAWRLQRDLLVSPE